MQSSNIDTATGKVTLFDPDSNTVARSMQGNFSCIPQHMVGLGGMPRRTLDFATLYASHAENIGADLNATWVNDTMLLLSVQHEISRFSMNNSEM